MRRLLMLWPFAAALVLVPAAASPPPLPEAAKQQFATRLLPLFQQHCHKCHSGEKVKGGLDLTTLDGLLAGGNTGPAIEPGDAKASLLIRLVQADGEPHMPPKKQLSDVEIDLLARWIESLPRITESPAASLAKGKNHWAFQPLSQPTPPVHAQPEAEWVKNPIDAFILAKLKEQQLRPAPPANKRDLIRRATFDLTGLPPTPQEIDAFLSDSSPQAFEKVIDRLLASPHYGERWGRHWLDLARYADSDGFEFDVDRPHAFRYRDYVIRSFNADKPYDRFILEQLAGDELDPKNPEALTATGFCRCGPTIDNQVNEKNRLDELDDILSTTSTVFLGLTIGCARCHDHKYDPISQKEYYELLAVFNSREKRDYNVATPEERQRLERDRAKIDAQLRELKKQLAEVAPPPIRFAGQWKIANDELIQELIKPDVRLFFGDPGWTDLILEVEAQRTAGEEGFLVAFRVQDADNFYWVNFGGWGNTQHGVEVERDGVRRLALPHKPGRVVDGRWYRIRISLLGQDARIFLDDELIFEFKMEGLKSGGVGLATWNTAAKFRNLRVRNLAGNPLHVGLPTLPKPEDLNPVNRHTREQQRIELQTQINQLEARKLSPPLAMGIRDAGREARKTFVLLRGDHRLQGAEVQPDVPAVLRTRPIVFPTPAPEARSTGRRLALAQWLAAPENPLTARVMVNRIWQYHFHRGLVGSASNFGLNGESPTHPELLDWLAQDFIHGGWRIKRLHKLIMLSNTYQQATRIEPAYLARDPDNLYLWRYPRKRLEAEAIRDHILATAGTLNREMFGPGVKPRIHPSLIATGSTPKWPLVEKEGPDHWRRSVYIFVKRSVLMPLMEGFDAPTAVQSCERRHPTTVPTQALMLMNNEFVQEQAEHFARRLEQEAGPERGRQIDRAYALALGRPPTPAERDAALQFLVEQEKLHAKKAQPAHQALADFCHVLFNLNEFVYLN
jgi:mono/diheme cytochrome c family protein